MEVSISLILLVAASLMVALSAVVTMGRVFSRVMDDFAQQREELMEFAQDWSDRATTINENEAEFRRIEKGVGQDDGFLRRQIKTNDQWTPPADMNGRVNIAYPTPGTGDPDLG